MPKVAKELTAVEIKRLPSLPGFHSVGGVTGLALNVKKSGAASWILRVKVGDKRKDIGMGSFPTVTLETARERARDAIELIAESKDPVAEKRQARKRLRDEQAKQITFRDTAMRCHAKMAPEFRSKKHSYNWLRSLKLYAFPRIGPKLVADVDTDDLVKLLKPIWFEKTDTAKRVRQRVESVLSWAAVSKMREGPNLARWAGNLSHLLSKPSKIAKVKHHAALDWKELPAFMDQLRKREGAGTRALEFSILTAARSGEVRLATWDELDLEEALWTISGDRMKNDRPHRVPLNGPAIALLRSLENGDYLFSAPRGGPLSDMSISAVCRGMEVAAVPDGFRSTFKDWCRATTTYADGISELALSHVNSDATRAAYARDDLLEVRRELMERWGQYCGI